MTTSEARLAIGQLVVSVDAFPKLNRRVQTPHGPYRLLAVTKGGLAILEGRDEERIPTSLIELCNQPHAHAAAATHSR